MTKIEILKEQYPDTEFLLAEGFDDAILGVVFDSMNAVVRLAYSREKCINILAQTMSIEEAIEYFGFNVEGAYMGEKTPIWVDDTFSDLL